MTQVESSIKSPELTVVVVIVSDTITTANCSHLGASLDALSRQENPPAMEILVPHHDEVAGMHEMRARFPEVRFLAVTDLGNRERAQGGREHHDELRARGIASARGQMVALLEDHARPAPSWAAQMVEALRQDYAGVGGAIENGVDRALNEAVYLCDFFRYQNPLKEGPSASASDANVIYKKRSLDAVRACWIKSFREPVVNQELLKRGEKLGLTPRGVVYQHRGGLTLRTATQERFIWARSYAATRRRVAGPVRSVALAVLTPALPLVLSARILSSVLQKGRSIKPLVKTLGAILWLNSAWSLGEAVGYLVGGASS